MTTADDRDKTSEFLNTSLHGVISQKTEVSWFIIHVLGSRETRTVSKLNMAFLQIWWKWQLLIIFDFTAVKIKTVEF
jgi:hypothetical protein